jgi:hypothetical protein
MGNSDFWKVISDYLGNWLEKLLMRAENSISGFFLLSLNSSINPPIISYHNSTENCTYKLSSP